MQMVAQNITYFEQDSGWTAANSANATFTSAGTANIIYDNAVLRVCGRDTANPSVEDCKDYTYSVRADGVVFGDTICTEEFEPIGPVTPGPIGPELTDIPGSIIPEDAIPVTYYPLLSLLIIGLVAGGTVFLFSNQGVKDGKTLIFAAATTGVLTWIGLVMMEMVAGWTLLVTAVLAAAVLGVVAYTRSGR